MVLPLDLLKMSILPLDFDLYVKEYHYQCTLSKIIRILSSH